MSFISFQTLYENCQALSSDDNTATLTLFKQWLNTAIGKAYGKLNAEYFYDTATDLTVDGQASYPKPYNCDKIHSIKVTVSSVDYPCVEFPGSETEWIALTGGTGANSENTYPTFFRAYRNTYEIWPKSSASGNTITLRYKLSKKDLSQANYTTGSILTATNGSTAIAGNAPSWTTAMVGRFIKITDDGVWYQIAAVPTATTITLAREFGGTSIAAGTSSYTIAEMSLLPEEYHDMPIDFALWMYYRQKKDNDMADRYKIDWNEKLQQLKESGGNMTTSGILEEDVSVKNPNNWPSGLS